MVAAKTNNYRVNIHHLTRVEGHGNIVVNVRNGVIEQCDLEIIEAPRFFEAMLLGKSFNQAPHLASRICGICSVSHAIASQRAVERALSVQPSEQTRLLRKLNLYAEVLDSHILHTYMLIAPDYLGMESVIPLAETKPDIVMRALRMKKLAGDICTAISGRHTHPISMVVGGFTHFPSKGELSALGEQLVAIRDDVDRTVALFQELSIPTFERDTEFLALHNDNEYCFIDGLITNTDGGSWMVEHYRDVTNEYLVTHSTAKHSRNQRQSFMVGALARFNINNEKLHPRAQTAAIALGLTPQCINPYMINISQVVEIVHCVEESIKIIDELLDRGIDCEEPVKPDRISGVGVGVCEAPRGTLYHEYTIKNGSIRKANCITPTAQNLANIEVDMRRLVPTLLDRPPDEITLALEMLVRAYDPCISCSTHMLEVTFV